MLKLKSRQLDWVVLGVAILLAVAARVVAARLLPPSDTSWQYEYVELGDNLAKNGQYTFSFYGLRTAEASSFLPPVYPLLLAASTNLFRGNSAAAHNAVQVIQVMLFVATLLAFAGITQELALEPWAKRACWLFFALYPPLVAYSVDISTALLETFFLQSALWLLLRTARQPHWSLTLGAGLSLALAMLTRPTWLIALPCALLWLAWQLRTRWRVAGLQLIVLLAAFGLLCAPWVWYNHHVHGIWQLTSTNGGLNLWIGNHPNGNGEYIFPSELDVTFVKAVAQLPEVARDQAFYQAALQFIRQNPSRFGTLIVLKLYYYLFFRPGIGASYQHLKTDITLVSQIFILSWVWLVPLAAVGIWSARRQLNKVALPLGIFIAQGLLSALYFTGTRFRTPIDSAVIVLAFGGLAAAGQALWRVGRQWRTQPQLRLQVALLALTFTVGMLYVNSIHPWQAPDEYLHYEYLRMVEHAPEKGLALTLRWTDRDSALQWAIAESFTPFQHSRFRLEPTLTRQAYQSIALPIGTTNFTPIMPLFYFLSLPLSRLLANQSVLLQLYIWRVVMVGLHVGLVWLSYRLARLVVPNQPWFANLTALFLALQPQYTFSSASYNNDNLLPILTTAALLVGLRGIQQRASLRHYVAFVLLNVLALLTKRTAVGALGVLAAGSLSYATLWLWQANWGKKLLGGLLWLTMLAIGISLGWVLWQQPTLTETQAMALRLPSNAIPNFMAKFQTLTQQNLDWPAAIRFCFQTFWGYFGWVTIPMGVGWYGLAVGLTGLGGLGGVVALYRYRRHWQRERWQLCLWAGSGLLLTVLAMWAQYLIAPISYAPHGRYLFPFIVPLGYLLVLGWQAWLPRRWQNQSVLLFGILLLGLNISALWRIVQEFYG
jgi:4-amino-4-deoxy-L-arabinose transferase-like glycosyltransferase